MIDLSGETFAGKRYGHMFLQALPRRLSAVAALTALIVPLGAAAQDVPSYARPAYVSTDETIHGRIRSVDGTFNISVDDDRGFIDSVQLHQGTVINPTGLTLSPGMDVTILGVNSGSALSANEIDTPYSYDGPLPTPVYFGPGYWCPGFAYGYGPSFSLAVVFGGGGFRPWYFENRPFYGRPWDGHAYFGPYVGLASAARGRIEGPPNTLTNDPSRRYETSLRTEPAVRTETSTASGHIPSAFAGRSNSYVPNTTASRTAAAEGARGFSAPSSYARASYARSSYASPSYSRSGSSRGSSSHAAGSSHSGHGH
jgi:hypothetical protein